MTDCKIKYLAEFTPGVWGDISADVLQDPNPTIRYGIQSDDVLALTGETGTLSLSLRNGVTNSGGKLGYYSPGHANCRTGFTNGLPMRVLVSHGAAKYGSQKFTQGPTTSQLFDGSTSYVNIYSDALAAVFGGAEGTLLIWAKAANAGVWTDAAYREFIRLQADTNNRIWLRKGAANNTVEFYYKSGGTALSIADTSLAGTTLWFCIALSWSKSGNAVKAYINGAQVGATQTGLGTWSGGLDAARTIIAAALTSPAEIWSGYLGHCALWSKALTPAQIATLSTVVPNYEAAVLTTETANLIGYWSLDDRAGSVAHNLAAQGGGGAIVATTLGQTGIGDGATGTAGIYGDVYEKFYGLLSSVEPQMGLYRERQSAIEARDWFDIAARQTINQIQVQYATRADQIIPEIFAECVVPPPRTHLETGKTTFPQSMDAEKGATTKMLTALGKVVTSEMGHAYMRGGTLAEGYSFWFEDRQYRLNHQTSIVTLSDTMVDMGVRWSVDDIWNSVKASVYPRRIDTSPTTQVAMLANSFFLRPLETKTFALDFRDPTSQTPLAACQVITPVMDTDWKFGTANVSGPTGANDLNALLTVTSDIGASRASITVYNTSSTRSGFVNYFQLRGCGIYVFDALTVDKVNTTSSLASGDMQKTIDIPYDTRIEFATAIATYYLALCQAWAGKVKSVSFWANRSDAFMLGALQGEPGKCFTLAENVTGINHLYCINSVQIEIRPTNQLYVTWTCLPADTGTYFRIGKSKVGVDTYVSGL